MDLLSQLAGQVFVWDSDRAANNFRRHAVRFEQARECFLDPLAHYDDASLPEEASHICIGLTTNIMLLCTVHLVLKGDVIRILSARLAVLAERRRYENE